MYCWSLAWRILSTSLLACEMSAIIWYFEHSLALPFFWNGMKTELFQSWGHCWVFQICWHIECSTLTASCFRTWNSSAGIPSPPLVLFVVQFRSVAQLCPTVCNSMNHSTPGLPVHHQLLESTKTPASSRPFGGHSQGHQYIQCPFLASVSADLIRPNHCFPT